MEVCGVKVAVVENNVITNVIVADAPDGITTYPIPGGKWIGDTYRETTEPTDTDVLNILLGVDE